MSEKLKESLSAVIDGEADEFELRRVLDEIGKDPALAASWERYHLIGAVMRRERITRSFGMRERVWTEVGFEGGTEAVAEPAALEPEVPAAGTPRHTGRWVSVGVAATVALAVAVGFVGIPDLSETVSPVVADAGDRLIAPQTAGEGSLTLPSQITPVALTSEITPVDQARTEAYVIRHLQQLGMNRSGIGFAKMVAYERE